MKIPRLCVQQQSTKLQTRRVWKRYEVRGTLISAFRFVRGHCSHAGLHQHCAPRFSDGRSRQSLRMRYWHRWGHVRSAAVDLSEASITWPGYAKIAVAPGPALLHANHDRAGLLLWTHSGINTNINTDHPKTIRIRSPIHVLDNISNWILYHWIVRKHIDHVDTHDPGSTCPERSRVNRRDRPQGARAAERDIVQCFARASRTGRGAAEEDAREKQEQERRKGQEGQKGKGDQAGRGAGSGTPRG
jgi:hypothetical protein